MAILVPATADNLSIGDIISFRYGFPSPQQHASPFREVKLTRCGKILKASGRDLGEDTHEGLLGRGSSFNITVGL